MLQKTITRTMEVPITFSTCSSKYAHTFAVLVLLASCQRIAESYRILIIPQPAKSHSASQAYLGAELVRRGHEVHMLFGRDIPLPPLIASNKSGIIVQRYGIGANTGPILNFEEILDNLTALVLDNRTNMKDLFKRIEPFFKEDMRMLLDGNEDLIERLEAAEFDLAIIDSIFFQKYSYLIPHRLGIPWITYTDIIPHWLVRVPYLSSFVPCRMSGTYTDRMTFMERLMNTILDFSVKTFISLPDPPDHVMTKYREHGQFSSLDDLISRSILFITTDDIVLDYAKPSMPNVIHVGGLTINYNKGSTLPAEINTFMREAKDGIILVTFGSTVSSFPAHIATKFIAAFELLGRDHRIIWRFKNKDNLEIPANVMILNWVPQDDILASGRVKVFITHCGNNGQFEAVYHGVPMIGFPLQGDQPYNAQRLVHKGYGLSMDVHMFTSEELVQNIHTIFNDVSYTERVRRASEIYRSAPDTALERATYWIEHVAKYGGDHLKSAGTDLTLFQYLMLDIVLVITLMLVLLAACAWKLLSLLVRKTCCRQRRGTINSKTTSASSAKKKN